VRAKAQLALVVATLLLAAALRSYRLAALPPGVEHDEVAEWQIARGILAGRHAIFFREAYGQEPVYLYLQAASVALLGDSVFALRFTSFAVAILTMAACYRLMRRLFGPVAALVSLALVAVTLWPLFFARVAIRGMTLPLVMCLGADALFSSLQSPTSDLRLLASNLQPPTSNFRFIIAGFWFGLAGYTYLAARAIPILLLAFTAYLALFSRKHMQAKWRGWVVMLALAALIAAPLAAYLLRNPDIQFRVDEVSGPLKQLEQGDPSGVLAGVRDTALMFSVRGDQTVRDNWPYRPVFPEPLGAALFYLGLAVALRRWRKPEYAFMLLWLVALLLPAMVTAAPPNFVRTLGALPPIFAFPGIAAATLSHWVQTLSPSAAFAPERRAGTSVRPLSPALAFLQGFALRHAKRSFCLLPSAFLILIVLNLLLTARDYFVRWPVHPETQFVWQTDLASLANYLDSARDTPPDVAIAGLSNETMDDSSLRLLLKRRDLAVRWFDSRTTLVIPSRGGRIFIPRIVPLEPVLHAQLASWGAQEQDDPSGRFTWFNLSGVRMTDLLTNTALLNNRAILSTPLYNGMFLLRYESSDPQVKPGGELTTLTYWQVTILPLPPLKAFVHLTDINGKLIAQSDGLNAPPQFWHTGDAVVQLHRFQVPPDTAPGVYNWQVGIYNSQTLVRVQFKAGFDHLSLPAVEVKP